MPYLVDGHNLIPKLGLRLDSVDDEMELIEVLLDFARRTRRTLDVFFDGAPPGHARTRKLGALTAHFIRLGQTADSAIRARLLSMGKDARNWTVVSSDREVQDAARTVHAESISSDEFARLVHETRRAKSKRSDAAQLSENEVDEWMTLFSSRRDTQPRSEES